MKNSEITLEQIVNQPFDNENIITDTHIILRYDDHPNKWEIYHISQAELSDPDPLILSEDPNEILNFLHTN